MDWKKAKTRLVILFMSINLLLIWANYEKEFNAYTLKDSQILDIKQVLESNHIYVDSNIPKEYKPVKKLTVLPYQMSSDEKEKMAYRILGGSDGVTVSIESAKKPNEKSKRIYKKGNEKVVFTGEDIIYNKQEMDINKSDMKEIKVVAEEWLRKIGYLAGDMYSQVIEEAGDVYFIYYDKYENIPVFDSYVKLHITSSGVVEAKIHKVKLGEFIGSKQGIYPANQVFFSLIKVIKRDYPVHIKDIIIGYRLENPKGTHLIAEEALPFYQVILDSGEIYYINAYNNELRDANPLIIEDLQ